MNSDPRNAISVAFPDGGMMTVGQPWSRTGREPRKSDPEITAITVSQDLPGLHCSLERVRVWVGDACVYEAAVHMVEGIEYALPGEVGQ